jgi:cell division protein FtsA
MNQENEEEVLTAVDFGSTKVCAVIGVVRDEGTVVRGMGQVSSHGLKKGTVVDIETTAEAVVRAVREAGQQAGLPPGPVFASIGGHHIHTASSQAMVAISNREREITQEDFDRVIEQAQNISIPGDHQILHAIVQEFSVDAQDGIRNPVGMVGNKLEARVRIVTGAITCIQNVVRSVQRAGLSFGGLILQALASEKAVLTHEERELGAACLDMGGGTMDLAVISGRALRHTAVITLGGEQITQDISFGLRIPFASAEEVKRKAGACSMAAVGEEESIQIPALGGRPARTVPRRSVARIIEPRIEEMLEMVRDELRTAGCTEEMLGGGLVLTGGCANLPGLVEKAEQVFERLSARIGEPARLPDAPPGLSGPQFATAVGLLMEAAEQRKHMPSRRPGPSLAGMTKWLQGFFRRKE